MTALVVVLAVAVGLLGVLVAGLLRSHAEILRALHRLGAGLDPDTSEHADAGGTVPPSAGTGSTGHVSDVAGVSPTLQPVAVAVAAPGRRTLLAFLSTSCVTCASFWDTFARADLRVPGGARLVIVTKGPEAESPSDLRRLAPPGTVVVMSSDAWAAYQVPGSPYFVLTDGDRPGVVGEGTGGSWPQVERLMTSALGDAGLTSATPGVGARNGEDTRDRGARVDAELRAAGIGPDHPSLYPAQPGPTGDE